MMAARRTPGSSTRRTLSTLAIALGILLLLVMPATLFVFAVTHVQNAQLPGTLVILTATGGMALIVIGAVIRET
jgi:hypothetical protein